MSANVPNDLVPGRGFTGLGYETEQANLRSLGQAAESIIADVNDAIARAEATKADLGNVSGSLGQHTARTDNPHQTTLEQARVAGNTLAGAVTFSGDATFARGTVQPFRSVTGAGAVLLTDFVLLADASATAFTLTLPTAFDGRGREFVVKKTDAGANAVSVAAASGEMVEGAPSVSLSAPGQVRRFYSDGARWYVIGAYL